MEPISQQQIGEMKMNTAVIIPAYQPDEKLINLVDELLEKNIPYIVIIDDGSTNKEVFNILSTKKRCQVIKHMNNHGKGSAIKTGIKAILDCQKDYTGIVTVDADGQHLVKDIIHVIVAFEAQKDALVLGCRDFSQKIVPTKSKLGNKITRFLFKLASGMTVTDTQTGLRAFSLKQAKQFLKIDGDRYEYEMNMLFEIAEMGIMVKEIKIETVYLDGNKCSHFNPLVDSMRVYKGFIKFGLSSVTSFLIDILLYAVFIKLFKMYDIENYILVATILARVISSVFNYTCNKKFVFDNKDKNIKIFIKYYMLCAIQMLTSAFIVKLIYEIEYGRTLLIKVVVDIFLSFISYFIQKRIVFKKE